MGAITRDEVREILEEIIKEQSQKIRLKIRMKPNRKENDMELISKKKLLETIEPMVGKFDDDGEFWWTRESILRAIDNAPTIEERKEGEWIELGPNTEGTHNIMCLNCGSVSQSKGHANSIYTREHFAYCPRCGARMKGE